MVVDLHGSKYRFPLLQRESWPARTGNRRMKVDSFGDMGNFYDMEDSAFRRSWWIPSESMYTADDERADGVAECCAERGL